MKSLITVEHVHKSFKDPGHRDLESLRDVSLHVREGEFLVLLGPSGCGKSTLLRLMSGLDTETSGKISFSDESLKEEVSFVFQQSAVLPWLTVGENVELNLIGKKVPKEKRRALVQEELKEFGLDRFYHSSPHELSGGMKQRVGLARAFVTSPKIIFLDEPFSELDIFTAEELRKELLRLWKEHNATVVMVSHNVDEAIELADRIVVFSDRPGHVKGIIENTLPRTRDMRSDVFFKMQDEVKKLLHP